MELNIQGKAKTGSNSQFLLCLVLLKDAHGEIHQEKPSPRNSYWSASTLLNSEAENF